MENQTNLTITIRGQAESMDGKIEVVDVTWTGVDALAISAHLPEREGGRGHERRGCHWRVFGP